MADVPAPQDDQRRAFLYARQSVRRDAGIKTQRDDNRRVADRRGLIVIADEADNNVSGTKARGADTGYAKMLRAWQNDEFDVLVVMKLARLIRNSDRDLIDFLGKTNSAGRHMVVIVADIEYDLNDAGHRNIFRFQAMLAQYEVEEKEGRRAPVITAARGAGHPKAGTPPYGFRWVDATEVKQIARATGRDPMNIDRYEVVPDEAAVLREIADRLIRGESVASIRRDLASRGVTTHAGVPFGSTSLTRAVLLPATVALLPPILDAGEQDPRKVNPDECVAGHWKPILSMEQWLAVRGVLLDPARRTNGGSTARVHLLSGVASCGECFLPMKSGKSNHGQAIYRCISERHNARRADVIDDHVEGVVVARLTARDARRFLRRQDGLDVSQLRSQRAEWLRRKSEVQQACIDGSLRADQIAGPVREFDGHVERIDQILRAANASDPIAPLVDTDNVEKAWSALSINDKQAVLRALMIITIHPLGRGGRVRSEEDLRGSITITWRLPDGVDAESVDTVPLPNGDLVPELHARAQDDLAAAVHK